jgi:ribosomal-protein-alanine N-acetyltransferase
MITMNKDAIFSKFPELVSDKLMLREILESDIEEVFQIYNNENVFQYCPALFSHNKETVRKMITHFNRDFKKMTKIKWGICLKDGQNKVVGIIEIFDINKRENRVEIGYFLNESYWGKGIASEAVRILTEFLLNTAEFSKVYAGVMVEHAASKNVLFKNAYQKEASLIQGRNWKGKGLVDIDLFLKSP